MKKNIKQIPKIDLSQETFKKEQPVYINDTSKKTFKPLFSLKNISVNFGKKKNMIKAVDDISLTFYDKQNVAFLGANGAGKTTTVEAIVGINKLSSGKIDFYDNSRESVGIQFQDSTYPSGLKVKDIINFILQVYDVEISEEEKNNIIESFGLKDLYKKNAKSLSGGQQQRLNVLLALLHKPKIVFLDELSTGLDISIRNKMKIFIKEYTQYYNINIVLVSHDVEEIETLCDRIIILQSGKVKIDIMKKEAIKKYG